jgi:hypothetical protein
LQQRDLPRDRSNAMSKDEVLRTFNDALGLPESERSGNLLSDELKPRASAFVTTDRDYWPPCEIGCGLVTTCKLFMLLSSCANFV